MECVDVYLYPDHNLLTCTNRVVNVDDVVFPGPGVGVAPHPVQVVVLVHGGQHRPMQLQGAEHGGAARAALMIMKCLKANTNSCSFQLLRFKLYVSLKQDMLM